MSNVIDIKELNNVVTKIIEEYTDEVKEAVKESLDESLKYAVKELKNTSPKDTEKYAKSWKSEVDKGSRLQVSGTVYNAKYYMKAHLLEFGHAKRGGGRIDGTVDARPHIAKVEESTIKKFEEGILSRL